MTPYSRSRLDPVPFRVGDLGRRLATSVRHVGPAGRLARQDELARAGWTGSMFDLVHAYSLTDEAFIALIRATAPKYDGTRQAEIAQEVGEALWLHDSRGWSSNPASYHAEPVVPTTKIKDRREGWEFHVFPSTYDVPDGEPGGARWRARAENQQAILRVRRVPGDRPWIVLVHGAGMGSTRTDMRIFDTERLAAELGVNLAMPVLPLYGKRKAPGGKLDDTLPSLDPVDTLHGLAQAIHDVRCVLAWIRHQTDAPIGLYGISLGGFTVSSVTALEAPLAAVVAGMPLVDVAGVIANNQRPRVRATGWFDDYARDVHRMQAVVTPIALPVPATPKERLGIYAGVADRVVPPAFHASLLAAHWNDVPIHWIRMSHTSHVMSRQARAFAAARMQENLFGQERG